MGNPAAMRPMAQPEERAEEVPARDAEWRRFYDQHWAWVHRLVRRFGGSGIAVEDAVQDVFLVAADRIHRFEGRSSLKTWLFRICINVGSEHRRRRQRQLRLSRAFEAIVFWRGPITPAEQAETKDALLRLERILDRMPEKRREILLLCELEGLSGEEAAVVLGIPPATVRTRLHAARRDLSERAAQEEEPR